MRNLLEKAPVLPVLVLVFLTSCGSSLMVPATKINEAPASHALVTFIRTTSYGGAIDYEIWDGETFIGMLDPKSYIQYEATPGKHTFLAFMDEWSYVSATLEAGKRYFIIGNISMGITDMKQVFKGIHKDDPEYGQQDIDLWLTEFEPTALDPSKGGEYAQTRVRFARTAIEEFKGVGNNVDILGSDEWH